MLGLRILATSIAAAAAAGAVSSALNLSALVSGVSISDQIPEPECWSEAAFTSPPEVRDCFAAARAFQADPFYSDNITYTISQWRVGQSADRAAPLYFTHDSCMLYLGAMPGSADNKFSLESKWPYISNLLLKCLVQRKVGHKYGGMIRLDQQPYGKGFLACVGSKPREDCVYPFRNEQHALNETSCAAANLPPKSWNVVKAYGFFSIDTEWSCILPSL